MIVDTHTDGQNFVEENGCITLLHLARYFASLPQREWLRRSVVFAGWPGHMTGEMPEAPGWALAHPELMKRSEEHTSELQSRPHLVCRLLLEKKNIYDDI